MKCLLTCLYKTFYVLAQAVMLFFILIVCTFSKRALHFFFHLYGPSSYPENVFNLCVVWLQYVGGKVGLNYFQINIVIFCIVWPAVTITSLVLNVWLLTK